jgi:hypothetical protein
VRQVGTGTAGWALRSARAGVLAAVALATGLTAHVSTGGATPAAGVLALLFATLAALASLTLGGPASVRRTVLLLLGAQTVIHLALTFLTGAHQHVGRGTGATVMVGMHHAQVGLPAAQPGGPAHLLLGADVLMLGAHFAAFALVGLWLAVGERALWTVLVLLARPVADSARGLLDDLVVHVMTADRATCRAPASRATQLPAPWRLAHRVVAHRGPPLPVA